MTRHDHPSRLRCLGVWLLATAATLALLPWLLATASRPAHFEAALVDLMAIVGAAATGWLWLLATLTSYDAARGQAARERAGVPPGVRRLLLAACGVAVATGGLALPAHADEGHARPSVLTGLPLPDRPTTLDSLGLAFRVAQATADPAAAPPTRQKRSAGSAVWEVRRGDSLWSIAAAHVSPGAGDAAIGRACLRLYQLNRDVIGDDPDLIHPGQHLRLPDLTQEDS